MYKCERCGSCCRNISKSDLYKELDRGDGVCKFLKDNLCSIYEKRPLICNIDKSYDYYFSNLMERQEYYNLNSLGCKKIKHREEE
ncbi:MAG: YkgJ family cysteine cluster protein [Peptostreptococcaceae bacterium]